MNGENVMDWVIADTYLVFWDSGRGGGERAPHRHPFCCSHPRIEGTQVRKRWCRIFESLETLLFSLLHYPLQL